MSQNKSVVMTKKPIRQDIKNLSDLEKQIKNLKSGKKAKKNVSTSGVGLGMKVATDLLAGVVVGVLIGYNLDSYFETKPLWLIVFLMFGLGAGISNVIKTANRLEQENKKNKL